MSLSIRDLFYKISEYKDNSLYMDILLPWIKENSYKTYLKQISNKLESKNYLLEDSWELYALSRVLDILALNFQPDKQADGSEWTVPDITINEYVDFARLLGLRPVVTDRYIPFYNEIIIAIEDKNNFQIKECLYPAFMLDNLLIKKAGVFITLNPTQYNLNIVNNSTIYWAYRRKNRNYRDLSQGWGSNSQWRTGFRFDFDKENTFFYNVTGNIDLSVPGEEVLKILEEESLTHAEAIELTVNRHFITSDKPDNDLFPYDYKYFENHN